MVFAASFVLGQVSGEIAPVLEEELEEMPEDQSIEVIIWTEETVHESNFSSGLEVEVLNDYSELDAAFLELPVSSIENVSDHDFVQRIGPNYNTSIALAESGPQIKAVTPGYNYTGQNVSIAVLDSGVADHPNLDVEEKRDFTEEGLDDLNGHGTHVAGVIGSKHGFYRGIAPDTQIHSLKVLDQNGSGKSSQMLRALDYVMRNDIDVTVMSLGTVLEACNGKDVMSRSVDQAVERGTVVVAAAGNEGGESSTLTAPGCSKEALTVGAVDKKDRVAEYSSRGPTADGRIKPDVVAPGTGIISTSRTGGFTRLSGTSMAAPHVAGQVSVLLSAGENPGAIKNNIMNSSRDLGLPENVQGSGRVDLEASLEATGMDFESKRRGLWMRFKAWLFRFTGV